MIYPRQCHFIAVENSAGISEPQLFLIFLKEQ